MHPPKVTGEDPDTQLFYPSLGQAWYTRADTKSIQITGTWFVKLTVM